MIFSILLIGFCIYFIYYFANKSKIDKKNAEKKQLNEEHRLTTLPRTTDDPDAREAAISNPNDQDTLLRLALMGNYQAFDKLSNSAAIAETALRSENETIRVWAIEKLGKLGGPLNQSTLLTIARDETNPENMRIKAVKNLDDLTAASEFSSLLGSFKGEDYLILPVVRQIKDAMALIEIASLTGHDTVRKACLEHLQISSFCTYSNLDPEKITAIIRESEDPDVKVAAIALYKRCNDDKSALSDSDHEFLHSYLNRKDILRVCGEGHFDRLPDDTAECFSVLSDEFLKFINEYVNKRVYVSIDEHLRKRGLEKIPYYRNIAKGLHLLHDQRGMAAEVESRFPEGSYTCNYYWLESGDNGSSIECDGWETIIVWEK